MKLFSIFCIGSIFMFDTSNSKSVTYSYQKQVCTTTEFTNLEWHITLISNGSFTYMQTEYSTVKNKLSIPNDTIFYNGFYTRKKDTLEVSKINGLGSCSVSAKYLIKADKLYPLSKNCIDTLKGESFLFLEREKR